MTQRLLEAGEILRITVLNRLIFSDESYHAMLEENELH
ncbi:MAG: hypothetical protein WCS59_06120 [Sphaerochaetaceae bacterium]